MVVRALGTMIFCKPRQLKHLFLNPLLRCFLNKSSFSDVICKVSSQRPAIQSFYRTERFLLRDLLCIHSVRSLHTVDNAVDLAKNTGANSAANSSSDIKTKRKKLKGKRAVVKWLKFLRWKKKKDYSRMTAEEKILFKLRKAQKKEERLVEALKKIEPKESSETTHDPEILTPEEHFYFLKMGKKCKNYVPVGRRGIYQGVILNMHLHWKKHQTLQVIVKTFTPDEVKEMAVELARLTGGIVLDILDGNTIIMYRGKNYSQPPTEIMSPRITLPRKKALDKSKHRDGLRAVRRYIPRLEQELELLHAKADSGTGNPAETQLSEVDNVETGDLSSMKLEASNKLREFVDGNYEFNEDDDALTDSDMCSDSEALSDIFETDCETESEKEERPLYLDAFEKFPSQNNGVVEDFEDQLRRISADSRKAKTMDEDLKREFDEVDRMVLQAASLLKKKKGWG